MKCTEPVFVAFLLLGSTHPPSSGAQVSTPPACDRQMTEAEFARPLREQERSRPVLRLADLLERFYVKPEIGKRMADALKANLAGGRYDEITGGERLAESLTSQLQTLGSDKHLKVRHRRQERAVGSVPAQTEQDREAARERFRRNAAYDGFGVQEVKNLFGNVGYLRLGEFWSPAVSGDAISGAMQALAGADALIVDLSDSHGGHEDVVNLIMGFFLRTPQLLFTSHNRLDGTHLQGWSAEHVAGGQRFADSLPIYVLTSPKTFSAAEMLVIALKGHRKAVVVGEATKGGAHGGDFMPISCRFDAFVPYYWTSVGAGEETWEGTGIAPDVKVPAADAMRAAYKLALERLVRDSDPAQESALEQEIREERRGKIAELERPGL